MHRDPRAERRRRARREFGNRPKIGQKSDRTIYNAYASSMNYPADYNDISYGLCGFYDGNIAAAKWDPCTGIGSPKGYVGK